MGNLIGTVVGGLMAGVIIAPIARTVIPGRQDISVGMTIVVGAIGAIVGGLIADALGVADTAGIDWLKHAIQVGVAVVVTLFYVSRSRRRRHVAIPEQ